MPDHSTLDGTSSSAVLLIALLVVTVAAAAAGLALRRPGLAMSAAIVGVASQVLHTTEHVGQLAHWFGHRDQPPWMAPLGLWAHRGFVQLGFSSSEGAELMHLVGNGIFLGGAVACFWIYREAISRRAVSFLAAAAVFEAFHLLEHATLTATVLVGGRPIGLSTGFGALSGPTLWTYRIWWHFIANVLPLGLLLMAVLRGGSAFRGWSATTTTALPDGRAMGPQSALSHPQPPGGPQR
jgi:hypothetical protein